MKKYLLLFWLTATAGLLTYSQSFQLYDSTGSLPNNTTIYKYGLSSADEIISYVFVKNNSATAKDVKVKKIETALQHEAQVAFCWGVCYTPEVFVSPDSITIDAGATNSTDFSGHYYPNGIVGISTVQYVFYDAADPTDNVSVNINFDTYPLGVTKLSEMAFSDAYPNPSNNYVNFSCSVRLDSDAKLIIRNVIGLVVKEAIVRNESGKISLNTSDLADGVYFYSLLVNGNSQFTKKLIIRH
jgi:hypothetical protein